MKRKILALLTIALLFISLLSTAISAESSNNTADRTITDTTDDANNAGQKEEIKGGLMAITFDDGPSKNTETLLDAMKERNINVTFFVVGERLDEFSDTLVREYKEGHEIGSHTWNHLNLANSDSTTANQNLQKTTDKINEIIGTDIGTPIIRPPYGSVNDNVRSYVNAPLILWSIDTLDWKYRDADSVKQRIIDQACDGAIILLHDLYDTSVAGAIAAIDELQKEGYTFVTVSELFRRKGQALEAGVTYTNAEENGIDLGPLPEKDTDKDNDTEKEKKKTEEKERTDKGFPTAWLVFCLIILGVYALGMLHTLRIIHIAPLDKLSPAPGKQLPPSQRRSRKNNRSRSRQ